MPLIEALPYEERLEMILGLDRDTALHHLIAKQGVAIQNVEGYCHNLRFAHVSMPRVKMEADRLKLHFVQYGLVRQRRSGMLLSYKRPLKGGELRIAGSDSVGVGGHVDGIDYCVDPRGVLSLYATLNTTAWREYWEEIAFSYTHGGSVRWTQAELMERSELFFHGFVIDRTEDVGMTHLGVFTTLWVDDDVLIDSGEDAVIDPHWITVEDALEKHANGEYKYENWSKFLLQHVHDHPRSVAPINVAETHRSYSFLQPK